MNGPPRKGPAIEYTYYPGAAPVPESVAVNIRGCSYMIRAEVKIEKAECSGVIFAHGSRFGGHSLFIGKDKKLYYVYNFLGVEEQEFVSRTTHSQPRTQQGVHLRRGVHEDGSGRDRNSRRAMASRWAIPSSPWTE